MRSVLCTERIPDNKSAQRTSETFHVSPFTIHESFGTVKTVPYRLYDHQILVDLCERIRAGLGDDVHILDPNAEFSGEIDARLVGDHHIGL